MIHMAFKAPEVVRCAQCKVDMPECKYGEDWPWRYGGRLYFCCEECKKGKEALIHAKQADTFERKRREKGKNAKSVDQYLAEQAVMERREQEAIAKEMAAIAAEQAAKMPEKVQVCSINPKRPEKQEEQPMQNFNPIEETAWTPSVRFADSSLEEGALTEEEEEQRHCGAAPHPSAEADTFTKVEGKVTLPPPVKRVNPNAKPKDDGMVTLTFDKAQAEYLAHMVEQKLLDIIPSGLDMDWLEDMMNLWKMLKKR